MALMEYWNANHTNSTSRMEMPKDRRNRKRVSNFVDTLLPLKRGKTAPTSMVGLNNNELQLPFINVADLKLESSSASPDDAPLAHYIEDNLATKNDEDDDIDDDENGELSPPIDDDGALLDHADEGLNGDECLNGADGNGTYFTCSHCNKFFWSEASLKHHSSLYHSEKSFVCEICGKAFRFRSNLAEHRSVHTSLKPYVCKYCGKSSRLKGNLTKHILKHHKKEQNAFIGKDDIIIRKGKKSVKDPAAVDFLEKSMIVLTPDNNNSASLQLFNMAKHSEKTTSFNGNDVSPSKRRSSAKSSSNNVTTGASRHGNSLSAVSAALASVSEIMDQSKHRFNNNSSASDLDLSNRRSSSKSALGAEDIINNCLPIEDAFVLLTGRNISDTPDSMNSSNFNDRLTMSSPIESPNSRLKQTGRNGGTTTAENSAASQPSNNNSSGQNTRCAQCGKHFRKAANLALHVATKHAAPSVPNGMARSDSNRSNGSSAAAAAMSTPTPHQLPNLPLTSAAELLLPSSLLKGMELFPSSPPPLKLGNRQALVSGNNSAATTSLGSLLMGADPTAMLACGLLAANQNSLSSLQKDIVNHCSPNNAGNSQANSSTSNVTKDLREIKAVLNELKRSGIPEACKVETLLLAVDARVNRLEKQVELSLATLYSLVQMQSEMNSAFLQFKCDVLEQLKSLHNTVKTKDDSLRK